MNKIDWWRTCAAMMLAASLAACGGGGSGSDNSSQQSRLRAPLPTLSQDIAPEGARIDLRDQQYFIGAPGDSWIYDRIQAGSTSRLAVSRTVSAPVAGTFDVIEIEAGTAGSLTRYARTPQGLVETDFLGAGDGALKSMIGDVLVYAEPFYAVGATRRVVRQGSAFEDLDGDGVIDSLRLEYTQVYLGQEAVTLPDNSTVQAAHFQNVTTITTSGSSLQFEPLVVTFNEDTWWVAHVGMVRSIRSGSDSLGHLVVPLHTLQLALARVGGQTLFQPPPVPQASVRKIALVHNDLVFDANRGLYYASVPDSVAVNGNRIAIVDAGSGVVSYSAPVGSNPAALALAADGSSLYVGLDGSGDVIRLGLPGLNEISRTRLPVGGLGQFYAESISVSPQDPGVVAVSLYYSNITPRHGGVALIRSGVLQPTRTQDHTGSNIVSFDGNGQFVYGFDNEDTLAGLRRLDVQADGLKEAQVVTADVNFGVDSIDWTTQGLVLGNAIYKAPELTLLGHAGTRNACRSHAATGRLVCLYTSPDGQGGQLAVVDQHSLVIQATTFYDRPDTLRTNTPLLVAGPAGQIALRVRDNTAFHAVGTGVWLVQDASLR